MNNNIITIDFNNATSHTPTLIHPSPELDEKLVNIPEPIKDVNDIHRISQWFITRERYRDNMLFILGINFGLEISDLLQLRFCHLINKDLTFKTTFAILEKKTKNTRKVKRNRYIAINDSAIDAITLYLEHSDCSLSDYLFRSKSNNGRKKNKPISETTANNILEDVSKALSLSYKISTQSFIKTFAYHIVLQCSTNPKKLRTIINRLGLELFYETLGYMDISY